MEPGKVAVGAAADIGADEHLLPRPALAAQVLDVMELLLTAASVDTQVDITETVTPLDPNGTGSFERLRDDLNELTAQYELEEEN